MVLNKNSLTGGRRYLLRLNVTMDGLDGRVFSFADFEFLTNLPPYGGMCSTATSNGKILNLFWERFNLMAMIIVSSNSLGWVLDVKLKIHASH